MSTSETPKSEASPSETPSSSTSSTDKIMLESIDGELFACERRAARLSFNISFMLDSITNGMLQGERSDGLLVIPLVHPACTSVTTERIVKWCEYHCDDPRLNQLLIDDFDADEYDVHQTRLQELLSYWDRRFISIENLAELYDLLVAAHFLQISGLIEVGAKHICSLIAGKTCEEVRQILNIHKDIPPDEERRINSENEWAFY